MVGQRSTLCLGQAPYWRSIARIVGRGCYSGDAVIRAGRIYPIAEWDAAQLISWDIESIRWPENSGSCMRSDAGAARFLFKSTIGCPTGDRAIYL